MTTLVKWAIRHGVSHVALAELREMMGVDSTPDLEPQAGKSEAAVQANTRLAAAQAGAILWRNNCGALVDKRGIPVRYGLCNDTKQLNKRLKSSDLIGIRPVRITPDMVGTTIGQFAAVECKEADWTYKGDDHEKAQKAFGELVMSKGGVFTFANSPECIKGW
ncbi:MAG: hypothetical protein ACRDDY_04375 [Clostridium sp.]|uniref:hypothetical protein n=1 Tax=Clostridium sp. TaxID=1506 RepID=UPI003EE55253